MTEQAQSTKPPLTIEQIKEKFGKANDRQKAMIRFAATIGVLRRSKAPEDIINDGYQAAITSFASDLQLAVVLHIIETAERTNAPEDIIIGQLGLVLCDKAEADARRLNNILELVREGLQKAEATHEPA
jgi:hypothetical protein